MSFLFLYRRTLLRGGMTVAGGLALAGLRPGAGMAAGRAAVSEPVTGGMIGWLVLGQDGSGQLNIVQVDLRGHPVRLIESVTVPAMTSLAGAARYAKTAAVSAVAASWQVPAADCFCSSQRIECRQTRRSIPYAIWTDFG